MGGPTNSRVLRSSVGATGHHLDHGDPEVPPPVPGALTSADSLKKSVSKSKVKRIQSSQIQEKEETKKKKTIAS